MKSKDSFRLGKSNSKAPLRLWLSSHRSQTLWGTEASCQTMGLPLSSSGTQLPANCIGSSCTIVIIVHKGES